MPESERAATVNDGDDYGDGTALHGCLGLLLLSVLAWCILVALVRLAFAVT